MFNTIIIPCLLFIAFLLLLFVILSVPIIETIYLFTLTANVSSLLENVSSSGKFGVWVTVSRALMLNNQWNIFWQARPPLLALDLWFSFRSPAIACAMNLLNFARICLSLYMLRRGSNGTARLPSLIMLDVGTLATQLTTGVTPSDYRALVNHGWRIWSMLSNFKILNAWQFCSNISDIICNQTSTYVNAVQTCVLGQNWGIMNLSIKRLDS
ncbi:pali-domain-containing protein [Lentinula edodes]|uniref:Pali-domain-containing protein n=1 Tax=Lentinula edodes TaxID=5353 RepID=A0A1Q3EMJ7_LENED|nr:pali-domain-containing protein [Lentinula edodes]